MLNRYKCFSIDVLKMGDWNILLKIYDILSTFLKLNYNLLKFYILSLTFSN
jgi:hypothetical protein